MDTYALVRPGASFLRGRVGVRIDWTLMDCQGFMKLLSVEKLGHGGATPIIDNQGLGRIQICGGGMGKYTALRVIKIFKPTLKPPPNTST